MSQFYAKTQHMKNKRFLFAAIMAFAVTMIMTACNKNTSATSGAAGQQNLSLYLTDGPGFFDEVYLNILSVKVLVDTSANTRVHDSTNWDRMGANENVRDTSFVWEDLNITPGVYDILQLRNGADTLLAASGIAAGSIRVIKIQLGTKNSLVKDSVTYPLSLPVSANNYILIKLQGNECDEYSPKKLRLWLDFDVQRSIYADGNHFILRPVFHFFTVSTTASLTGNVTPMAAQPVITVYNSTDTAYALPDKQGNFKVRGLKEGTYSVYFNASNGYIDTTINNVIVKAPNITSVGSIKLRN